MREIERITSRDNRRLADVRGIRDGKDKTRIFIEGKRLVDEALRSEIDIEMCFVVDELTSGQLVSRIAAQGTEVAALSEKLFRTIADTDNSQGIILIAKRPSPREMSVPTDGLPIIIFLNEINNPSNVGAVLRTAEAAGVTNVVVSKRSADVFSPKALRSSMGSAFRLNIIDDYDLEALVRWSRENGVLLTAADIGAEKKHTSIDWSQPRALVFGSEAHGLGENELRQMDELVRIEMSEDVESLNLAVSAGILLFEARRQNS